MDMINCNLCNLLHVILFQGGDAQANLSVLLVFSTGTSSSPPLGFANEPVIEFTEGEFPKANMCAPILYLPLGHSDNETFKEKCDFGFSIRRTLDMRNIRFLLVSCH